MSKNYRLVKVRRCEICDIELDADEHTYCDSCYRNGNVLRQRIDEQKKGKAPNGIIEGDTRGFVAK